MFVVVVCCLSFDLVWFVVSCLLLLFVVSRHGTFRVVIYMCVFVVGCLLLLCVVVICACVCLRVVFDVVVCVLFACCLLIIVFFLLLVVFVRFLVACSLFV